MPSDPASHPRHPKVSDDELLALVCRLGDRSDPEALRRALSVRANVEAAAEYVTERIERLRRAGLVRFVHAHRRGHDAGWEPIVRLTAAGVERLQALQREPLRPATE
jgi:hypothetical protein